MVSQREVRGEPDAMLQGVRAALRENPDVLVIDDLQTPNSWPWRSRPPTPATW